MSTVPMNVPNTDFMKEFFNMSQEEMYKCNIYSIKMFVYVIILIIIFCCLASSINAIFFSPILDKEKDDTSCIENLTMTDPLQYEKVVKNSYTRYDASDLTPLKEQDLNMVMGKVDRILHNDNGDLTLYMDINAGLYILGGDPFGEDPAYKSLPNMMLKSNTPMNSTMQPYTQEPIPKLKRMDYLVYLMDDNGRRVMLDALYRDNDHMYKLRYTTADVQKIEDILKFNIVSIVLTDYTNEQEVLRGRLKRLQ